MRSTGDGETHCTICEVTAAARDHTTGLEQRGASVELLVGELQHRIRNLLTVVQCVVSQTEAATADGLVQHLPQGSSPFRTCTIKSSRRATITFP